MGDQITHIHAGAYARLDVQDHELQSVLQDRLTETQQLSQRSAAKSRERIPGDKVGVENDTSSRHCSKLKPGHQSRRSSSHKSQELLRAYESTHMDLHRKLQKMSGQLEEERRARAEQELAVQRLRGALEERSKQCVDPSAGSLSVSAINHDADVSLDCTMPTRGVAVGAAAGGARALRQEFGALRKHERVHRSERAHAARVAQQAELEKKPLSGAGHLPASDVGGPIPRMLADPSDITLAGGEPDGSVTVISRHAADREHELRDACDTETELFEALAHAEHQCCEWEEAHAAECCAAQVAERLATESESALADASRVENELLDEVQAAEARNWALVEVANEIAMRADMREMRVLQGEFEMQQELQAFEHRCAELQQVAQRAVAHAFACEH